ncbi:uncharacterized protein METZ01_LOCUS239715, partial [marine metagenome]
MACRETVAAFDRIDQQSVCLIILNIIGKHLGTIWQVEVGVATEALVCHILQGVVRIMPES